MKINEFNTTNDVEKQVTEAIGGTSGMSSKQAQAEIKWIDNKIAKLQPLLQKRPRVQRQINDLLRQRKERELAIAFDGSVEPIKLKGFSNHPDAADLVPLRGNTKHLYDEEIIEEPTYPTVLDRNEKILIQGTRGKGKNKISFKRRFKNLTDAEGWIERNKNRSGINIVSVDADTDTDTTTNDNSGEEYYIEAASETSLPPHLAKFIDAETGDFTQEVKDRMGKATMLTKPVGWIDRTPKGYGIDEATDSNTAYYLITDGTQYFILVYPLTKGSNSLHLRKMIDQKAKELGIVKNTSVVAVWHGDLDTELAAAQEELNSDTKWTYSYKMELEKKVKTLSVAKQIVDAGKVLNDEEQINEDDVTDEQKDEIRKEYEQMKKASSRWLKNEYTRYHNVSDTNGMRKGDMIADLLHAKFGSQQVKAAFATMSETRDPYKKIKKFLDDKLAREDYGQKLRKIRDKEAIKKPSGQRQ